MAGYTAEGLTAELKKREPVIYLSLFHATIVKSKELQEQGLMEMTEPQLNNIQEHAGERRRPELIIENFDEYLSKVKEYHKEEGPFTQEQAEEVIFNRTKEILKEMSQNSRGWERA